jgi:hypothetical protein
MRSALLLVALLLVPSTALAQGAGRGKDLPVHTWRSLALIQNEKVDPSWSQVGGGGFIVDNGTLRTHCDASGMGLLVYTKEKFGNCQIRVVFRTKEMRSNSGVYVRIDDGILKELNPKSHADKDREASSTERSELEMHEASEHEKGAWYAVHRGFEVQICDHGDAYHRTGAIYSLAPAAPMPNHNPTDWKTMIITLRGNVVQVQIDGKLITTFDSASKHLPKRKEWYEGKREPVRPTSGYIGLQNHDPGDVVWFKEVAVRPLGDSPSR